MLKIFRKKGFAKKVLWTLATVVILSFGFFGTANYLTGRNRPAGQAGKIFGKNVSFEEFQEGLMHTRVQAIMTYGDNFRKISQLLNLDMETWDRLILLHEARRRKIKVSDDEVVKAIENMKFFQENDEFKHDFYERIVRYVFECTPRDFEEGIRESLLLSKLYEQESLALSVTPDEVRDEYARLNEKIQVDFVLVNSDDFKPEINVSDQDMKEYFDKHQNEFFMPPTIDVEYLQLPYPENKDEIDESQFIARINVIAEDLKKSQDVKEVAQRHGVVYGETGFFGAQQPNLKIGFDPKLLSAAFDLQQGEMSEPIKTEEGYFIVKVRGLKDAYVPAFEEAQPKVKEAVVKLKAEDLAEKKAELYLSKIKDALTATASENFSQIVKDLGLKSEETAMFGRGEYLPTIGVSQEFQDAAFALNEHNKLSPVVKVPKGHAILYFKAKTPVDEKKFAEEQETYEKALLTKKKSEAFTSFLNSLRSQAQLEDNISRLRQVASRPPSPGEEN